MKMAPVLMKMAPGTIPHPDRVPEQRLLSPETEFQMAVEHGGVFAIMTIPPRVYTSGAYIGEEAASGAARGGVAIGGRGPHLGRAHLWRGGLGAPLCLPFGLHVSLVILLTVQFISSDSENISLIDFLNRKTAENRELALWHLVNRLVPENV